MVIDLDLETTSLNPQTGRILICGYRIDDGEMQYGITDNLKELLSNKENVLRGANIKFDALFLANNGCTINCTLEDIRVLAYLNWPEEESHSLKHLVRKKLRGQPTELSDIQFKPLKRDLTYLDEYKDYYYTFDDGKMVRKDYLKAYHREDILNISRLSKLLRRGEWYNSVEQPLTRILFNMELYGCPINRKACADILRGFTERAENLLHRLREVTGNIHGLDRVGLDTKEEKEEFNPNSPIQVREAFKGLGFDLEELCDKTDKGAYKVDKPFLKRLMWNGCDFAKLMLDYRKYDKLLGTYLEPFYAGSERDGRLHGSINQAGSEDMYGDGSKGTNTGRLSSSNPNLQNIPSRTAEGREVRKTFVASPDQHMFVTDLSQIEPRLVAHYTQAPKLIHAYNNGLDTHSIFAGDIFGTPNPTKDQRFIGKSSWLATVYGCGYKKLLYICENFSDDPLNLPLEKHRPAFDHLDIKQKKRIANELGKDFRRIHAEWMFFKDVQDTFKRKNPEIFSWRDAHIERTRRLGYVITLGGRRITIEGLDSSDPRERFDAERRSVNYLIQGSAADVFKLIAVQFEKRLVEPGLGRLFSFVHDEVLGEISDPKNIELVKDIMENTVSLRNVKIQAETQLVNNWSEKK